MSKLAIKEGVVFSKEESKEVKTAILHTAVRIVGKTETTLNTVKIPKLKMFWIPGEGLSITSPADILIPAANVAVVYF